MPLASQGNKVGVNVVEVDRYGRSVAEVYLPDGRLVQEIQAREGMVFSYERYKDNCPSWDKVKTAGELAKAERKGVWKNDNPEYPWDYRKKTK